MNDILAQLTQNGQLHHNVNMAQYSWFQCGGTAEMVYTPNNQADLVHFLRHCPRELAIYPLGAGSNSLFNTNHINACFIKLGKGFFHITHNDQYIQVGAATPDIYLAQYCAQHGMAGAEFFIGIPGLIGGAVVMNAGCFGGETAQILHSIECLDRHGETHHIMAGQMGYGYRTSQLPAGYIVIGANFYAKTGNISDIKAKMASIKAEKYENQPMRGKTGGSTFKNPPGHKAWQLLDAVGMRGFTIGGAQFDEKHCNFIMNINNATANDIAQLVTTAQQRVWQKFAIALEAEIVIY